jgi:hypothetical protein
MTVVLPDTKGFYLLSIFMYDIQSFRNPILAIEHTDNQMFQNENVTVFRLPHFFRHFFISEQNVLPPRPSSTELSCRLRLVAARH